jgi:hypothetical protein
LKNKTVISVRGKGRRWRKDLKKLLSREIMFIEEDDLIRSKDI